MTAILFAANASAQPCTWNWVRNYGSSGEDKAVKIVRDASGNLYVYGVFAATTNFGQFALTAAGTGVDLFVLRMNDAGTVTHAWKAGGANKNEVPGGLAVDATGNIYLSGTFNGTASFGNTTLNAAGGPDDDDVFVAKINPTSGFEWARRAGGVGRDGGYALALNAAGTIFVGGEITGAAAFGEILLDVGSNWQAFVAAYNSAGAAVWAKATVPTGTDNSAFITDLTLDPQGNLVAVGSFPGTVNFGASVKSALPKGLNFDMFVGKFNPNNGGEIWVQTAGGTDIDIATCAAVDGNGRIFTAGNFFGSITFPTQPTLTAVGGAGDRDVFIASYSASGAVRWAAKGGGAADWDEAYAIAIDPLNNVYVGGQFFAAAAFDGVLLSSGGGYDGFIVKYDNAGPLIQAVSFGGAGGESCNALVVNVYGEVFAAGYFSGTVNLGSQTLTAPGSLTNAFVGQACAFPAVWPGDANNDGAVTTADYFFTAGAYGIAGPPRPQQGVNWQAYRAGPGWLSQSSFQGQTINNLYLDANGDGVVNLLDVAVTVVNRGRTR
ncbi:MAG: hypothetical protein NZ534_00575 [Bacteroidia bacterium]|nr:hypothetical protein [Bacteroidia bacterium]